ncbi:hypothetical protein QBC46DRAFT_280412 [Diplogelasinospora grovesii]|uniref:Acyl-CoA dehydrogenase n=1 Tax=Diplogelasinospora grovesii TaxID=303347 RepID=A0AAN6S8M9_9PEZI|nr:hypothetical protein QBC46DRAFT_280412 [Diplogelasinospora grovesii]
MMNDGKKMEPSSSNTGFFQPLPTLANQWLDDVSLQRVSRVFLPPSILSSVSPGLRKFGEEVLDQQIFDWVTDAERNLPYLRGNGRDAFGRPLKSTGSELVTTEGWRKLQECGFRNGVIATGYDTGLGEYARVVQFLRLHLWEASCANTTCPGAMQDGAARLLQLHLTSPGLLNPLDTVQRRVFQNAFDHLTSRDPTEGWTSGQWMTERTGGSDVSLTETIATFDPCPPPDSTPLADTEEGIPLGPWSISGFKWFSSATDSQMAILLARTAPDKGVSAFYAPMRKGTRGGKGGELNGVIIQRLKNKLGTQSLPTAELELKNMRGWLIGEEGKGIQEIATVLNITRVHSAVASMGYLGRGLGIAKAYALVREVGVGRGRRARLCEHPLHMRTLANITVEYHGLMLLTFFTLSILGVDEHPQGGATEGNKGALGVPKERVGPLLRVLSSLHKAYVCETAIPLVYGCMQALGGVGYLLNSESEQMNVARLFRDACVLAIWEGTTDVLASDTLRALKKKESLEAVDWFVKHSLSGAAGKLSKEMGDGAEKVSSEWGALRTRLKTEKAETLLPEARQLVFRIAEILITSLYLIDMGSNPGREIEAMCLRYMVKRGLVGQGVSSGVETEGLEMDAAIVYGSTQTTFMKQGGSKL